MSRCECQKPGCSCANDADLIRSDDTRVSACCLVACPDAHGDMEIADARA